MHNVICDEIVKIFHMKTAIFRFGLGTYLFVKVPRIGESEVTFSVFESSCHLLLPF